MSFSFDPQSMLGSMSQGLTNLPIIIGLPCPQAIIPNFVVGITTEEKARTSNTLPGFQLSAGDLFLKSARNAGTFNVKLIVSETPNVRNETIKTISSAMQQLSTIASSFAAYGGVLPNIAGISSNFAIGQLNALQAMKDNFQPILALNLYMPLATFSTKNPFLTSSWYIEDLSFEKGEAERGVIADITFRELLLKRSPVLSIYNVLTNLANELLGPGVGSSIGSVL